MPPLDLTVVSPVFNDWEPLRATLEGLDRVLADEEVRLSVIVVDDGSTEEQTLEAGDLESLERLDQVELLHLTCNLGHQRAIAVGIAEAVQRDRPTDAVLVMDSDGEDRPEEVLALLQAHRKNPETIVVAQRTRRSEGPLFRFGYILYKTLFRTLTGKSIPFGNFCLLPRRMAERMAHRSDLWNHLAASVLRSRLPVTMVPTTRGTRFAGSPKMNLASLVVLGMSAVSAYSDVAMVRTLLSSVSLGAAMVLGIMMVTGIRVFTDWAIPGWASDVAGSLAVILAQSLLVPVFVLFIILNGRNQPMFIPARGYTDYILDRETLR